MINRMDDLAFLRRSAILRAVSLVVRAGTGALLPLLAIRQLGADGYGYIALGLATVSFTAGAAADGLGNGITRDIAGTADGESSRRLWGTELAVLLSGGVALAVVAVIAGRSEHAGGQGAAVGAAVMGIGIAVCTVSTAVARGRKRLAAMEIPPAIAASAPVLALGGLMLIGRLELAAVSWAMGAAGITVGAFCLWLARSLLPRPGGPPDVWGALRTFGATAVLTLVPAVAARFGVTLLGATAPADVVGTYDAMLRTVQFAMTGPLLIIVPSFLPVVSDFATASQRRHHGDLYRLVTRRVLLLGAAPLALLTVFPHETLGALYGADFRTDVTVLWLLVGGYTVNLVFGLSIFSLMAVASRRTLWRLGLPALLAALALTAGAVGAAGARGAAAAAAAILVVLTGGATWQLVRVEGVNPFDAKTGASVLALATLVGCLAASRAIVGSRSGASVSAALAALGAVAVAAAFALVWNSRQTNTA